MASVTDEAAVAIEIQALGDYWHPDRPERSPLGELIHQAKDLGSASAGRELVDRCGAYLAAMPLAEGTVLAVMPPSPDRPAALLQRLATDLEPPAGTTVRDLVVRHHSTPRVRDLEPSARPAVVAAAGYEVVGECHGVDVVLIDDVVLTGTTLQHVAGLLRAAGAASVTPVALARSRRR